MNELPDRDIHGRALFHSPRRHPKGWQVRVWRLNDRGLADMLTFYVYRTKHEARRADYAHEIGESGRIA